MAFFHRFWSFLVTFGFGVVWVLPSFFTYNCLELKNVKNHDFLMKIMMVSKNGIFHRFSSFLTGPDPNLAKYPL